MRTVTLFGVIETYSAQDIIMQLLALDKESSEDITMVINSPGGSVDSMFLILDIMDVLKSKVNTAVLGKASSAAGVIASHGKKRYATKSSTIMLHEAWGIVGGSIKGMKDALNKMTKSQDKLLGVLAKNTGKSKEQILSDIQDIDKEFTAKEALDYGLIDEIISSANVKETFKLSEKLNAPIFDNDNDLSEMQVLKTGTFNTSYGKLTIRKEHLDLMVENFKNNVRGIDISYDVTHDNEFGEKKAVGWLKDLEVRKDLSSKEHNLFAKVEFTPEGQNLVRDKAYKYTSAEFLVDYEDDKGDHYNYVLVGGTLTNRPQIKGMEPIKLSEEQTVERNTSMNREQLLQALKKDGLDVVELQSQVKTLTEQNATFQNKISDLNKLPTQKDEEIKTLKAELNSLNETVKKQQDEAILAKKNQTIDSLISEGKVFPAQKDKILKTFSNAEDIIDFYKDAKVVVNIKAEGSGDVPEGELTAEEQAVVNQGLYTKEEILKNR